jgi:hypothetical protein
MIGVLIERERQNMSELLAFTPVVGFGLVVAAISPYAIRRERRELRKAGDTKG